MASLRPSVRVVKSMPFKGGTREFSNRYYFNGGTPADATHWDTLFDTIVNVEKGIHIPSVIITACHGYATGSDVAVRSKVYATAGTLSGGASSRYAPGEVAALGRCTTGARTTKNHPIYLFSYYHHVLVQDGSIPCDKLDANQKSAIDSYLDTWVSGFSDGTNTYVRASPRGAAATGAICEQYVTHRDFPPTTSV
jgi:hypothetical protein